MNRAAEPPPLVTAPSMGYGHMRAARSIAEALGVAPMRSDLPPLAAPQDVKTWKRLRELYERICRVSQWPGSGLPAGWFLEWLTAIPKLHADRDLSLPTRAVHSMERYAGQGFCRALTERLAATDRTLVSAFYAEPIAADRAGHTRAFCVVTDTDANRVWAPMHPERTRIHYFAPTHRVARRLRAYGLPDENVTVTGFPLPPRLVGMDDDGPLLRNLSARLARLDPNGAFSARVDTKAKGPHLPVPREAPKQPPLLVFAVGGAGAQTGIVKRFLPGVRDEIRAGRLRLALVAGTRSEVEQRLVGYIRAAGLGDDLDTGARVQVLRENDFATYYTAFNELLAEADILWTKPSEMVFYAALGLPLLLSPPVGVQERANARWVLEHGAAVLPRDPRHTGAWLREMIEDGLLAGAAWSGYLRLPHDGARRIARAVREAEAKRVS